MLRTQSRSRMLRVAVATAFGLAVAAKGSSQVSAPTTVALTPKRQVVVSIPDRKLAVLEDGKVLRVFQVAVGADVAAHAVDRFQLRWPKAQLFRFVTGHSMTFYEEPSPALARAMQAMGDARPAWEIIARIGARLGFAMNWPKLSDVHKAMAPEAGAVAATTAVP